MLKITQKYKLNDFIGEIVIKKVNLLADQYRNEIRPLLIARGRNSIPPVAKYVGMMSVRFQESSIIVAERIILNARRSKRYPLAFWASDIRVLYKNEAPVIVSEVVDYYRARAKLSEEEKGQLHSMLFESETI